MKDYPKISIITPTLNSERFIERTILSVKEQNYSNLEYIIVDGLSSDSTLKLVENSKFVNKVISEKDNSLYDAINKGIEISSGDLIKILNSDDMLKPNVLRNVGEIFSKSYNKSFVIDGFMEVINLDGSFKAIWNNENTIINNYKDYNHPTWFVPKTIYDDLGLYETKYKICGDREYYYRLMKNNIEFQTIKEPIVIFRLGGLSYTNSLNSTSEILEINLKYFSKLKSYTNFLKICILKVLQIIYNMIKNFIIGINK